MTVFTESTQHARNYESPVDVPKGNTQEQSAESRDNDLLLLCLHCAKRFDADARQLFACPKCLKENALQITTVPEPFSEEPD